MLPTQIGPYQIRSRLGRGGMGEVFEAVDPATGETVAVKILRSHLVDDPGVRQRFESEIEALKNLRHPGIVRMLAFGAEDDEPYFAMEFVRGKSLEQVLRSGRRFTWRETVAVACEVTRALKAAHDLGIIHRDLKPANLLVVEPAPSDSPAPISVKLADFGIAKLFGGVAHTAHNHVVGTAEFMAPEQAAGRPLDHRADLYALGLVMYAMMTGSSPFRGTQLTEIIDKQKNATPPRLAGIVKGIPAELDALVARLLSKDPAQRPASALALGRLLSAVETLHPPGADSAAAAAPSAAQPGARGQDVATAVRTNQPTARGPSATGARPPAATDRQAASRPARPQHPTAPATGGLRGSTPQRGQPDPLAATQPRVAPPSEGTAKHRPPAAAGAPTAGSTDETEDLSLDGGRPERPATASSRLSTDIASAKTLVDEAGARNRFTTIIELERAEARRKLQEQRRQHLWNGLTIAILLTILGFGARWLLRRPTADELHASIMAVAAAEQGDLRDASDAMDAFLERFADDPRAGRVRELKLRVELDALERRARRRLRGDSIVKPIERDYRAAMAEEESGPSACLKALEAMLAVYEAKPPAGEEEDTSLWLDLARRQAQRLRPRAAAEQRDDTEQITALLAEADSLADRAGIANDVAARAQFVAEARKKYETVIQVYEKRPHAAEAIARARRAVERLEPGSSPNSDTPVPVSKP